MTKEIVKHIKEIFSTVYIIWFSKNLLIAGYYIEDRMTYPTVVPTTTTKGRKGVFIHIVYVSVLFYFL